MSFSRVSNLTPMKSTQLLLAALLCGIPLAASAQVGVGIGVNVGGVVREAPPAPMVETYGPQPVGPGWIWVGGHWARRHGRWIWINGRWDRRVGYMWGPGHWDQSPNGWVWVEGQWVVPIVPAAPGVATSTTTTTTTAGPVVGEFVVEAAPPAPIVETYGPAPGPDYFFISGHWGWADGQWVWTRGYWGRHPHWHAGGGWVGGRWDRRGNGYVWREGHWR